MQVVHITLHPCELLKLHATPIDVFLYTLEGRGIAEIGGERGEVGQIGSSRALHEFRTVYRMRVTRYFDSSPGKTPKR